MNALLLAKIEGNIGTKVKFLGIIVSHLLDKGENHIDGSSDLQGLQFVIIFANSKFSPVLA